MSHRHQYDRNMKAPAKLTLNLRVTGVRTDGFHLIDAEMVSLDIADDITIEECNGPSSLTIDGPFSDGLTNDASNLVLRALTLVQRNAHVHLTKNIPHGGGLGGGSTDAAAVLRWASFTDLNAASQLGADIPFCIHGGRARVEGIGEVLTPLPFEPLDITLVIPPFGVSTPKVYATWDALDGPRGNEGPHGLNDLRAGGLSGRTPPRAVARQNQRCGGKYPNFGRKRLNMVSPWCVSVVG
jgi:4-diphosphocytidyl-2-C-methyl-D-erythritol kinase